MVKVIERGASKNKGIDQICPVCRLEGIKHSLVVDLSERTNTQLPVTA